MEQQTVEERIATIQFIIKELFPEAVSVNIFINSQGIDVTPHYKTLLKDYSIQNISGNWVRKI
jgi:D-serine dehydratase